MGVPASHPEVEAGRQKILAACKAHKIACNITANPADDIVRLVNDGWHMIVRRGAINAARPRLKDPNVAPPRPIPSSSPGECCLDRSTVSWTGGRRDQRHGMTRRTFLERAGFGAVSAGLVVHHAIRTPRSRRPFGGHAPPKLRAPANACDCTCNLRSGALPMVPSQRVAPTSALCRSTAAPRRIGQPVSS